MTEKEFTVVVTGFGANLNAPYGNATSNPSSLIATLMAPSLPPTHSLNPTSKTIHILNSAAKIPGEYATIRSQLQSLHAQHGSKVDLWIHLGRGPWPFVTCERKAFRQDFTSTWLGEDARTKGYYHYPDNAGMAAADVGECPWIEKGVPMGLGTEVDVNAVVRRANERLAADNEGKGRLEVRSHFEAADKGCGYAYYESLANCYVAGRKRDVLFRHVPRHTDEEAIEKGRDAVLAIIGAAVAAIVERDGRTEPVDWAQEFGLEP